MFDLTHDNTAGGISPQYHTQIKSYCDSFVKKEFPRDSKRQYELLHCLHLRNTTIDSIYAINFKSSLNVILDKEVSLRDLDKAITALIDLSADFLSQDGGIVVMINKDGVGASLRAIIKKLISLGGVLTQASSIGMDDYNWSLIWIEC